MGTVAALIQCGREITTRDVEHVRKVVEHCEGLSREELAHTVCEHWGWETASGAHKVQACLKLLGKLEDQGMFRLPVKQSQRAPRMKPVVWTERTVPQSRLCVKLAEVRPVELAKVCDREAIELWNEYVDRHHPLGYRKPFGFRLRYFIESARGRLGCVLLSGAAKSIGVRDAWIGWSDRERLTKLPWVINNSRFLVLPWVHVPHLASHVLGQLARRVRLDWAEQFGYQPVLMETFVNPAHFAGTCYRAAGWMFLGHTTGEGLRRPGRDYTTTPKQILVRPLVRDFRNQLCSTRRIGRVEE